MTDELLDRVTEIFLDYHRGKAVYVNKKKTWFLIKNNVWHCYEKISLPLPPYLYIIYPNLKNKIINEARRFCTYELTQDDFRDILDKNHNLIAFNNGVLDLTNKCFRPIKPTDYISVTISYDWKTTDNLEAENFINDFFDSLMGPDKTHLIWQFLLNVFMSKPTTVICTGANTANGKTIFKRLIGDTFNNYYINTHISDIVKHPCRNTLLHYARGVRFVGSNYTNKKPFIVTKLFKKEFSIYIKSYAPVIVKDDMVNEVMLFHFPTMFDSGNRFTEKLFKEQNCQQLMRMLFRRYCLEH